MQGEIVIADAIELFESVIGFWSPKDYESQWMEGAARAAVERETSCFITSLTDPLHAEYIKWWLLYPTDERIVLQEGLLILDKLSEPFLTSNPYSSIPLRARLTEDGYPVSEWDISRAALLDYVRRGA